MAASDAKPIPLKNTAYRVTFPIFDADGDLVSGAAGLDSERSLDGAAFADCSNEATEIAAASGMYYLDLTAAEMNADTVAIIVKTSTSGAKTTPIVLYPEEAGDIRVNVTQVSGDTTAADNLEADYDGDGYNKSASTIGTATALSAAERNSIADALLKRDWTAVTGEAARSVLNALRRLRNKNSVAAGTLTVTEEDDATEAWTATLTTDAAAEPVIAMDPD